MATFRVVAGVAKRFWNALSSWPGYLWQLDSHKLNNTDTWMVRVDGSVRLLFKKTDQGFLIIDIIDRKKEDD
ncbi:MAG: hypothetical protein F6K62_06055 [Sphaerospermopsis sp. SIO1G2]|nr:hypothetical protein [Sphaerospermopsis sp. SIO1G2]